MRATASTRSVGSTAAATARSRGANAAASPPRTCTATWSGTTTSAASGW